MLYSIMLFFFGHGYGMGVNVTAQQELLHVLLGEPCGYPVAGAPEQTKGGPKESGVVSSNWFDRVLHSFLCTFKPSW